MVKLFLAVGIVCSIDVLDGGSVAPVRAGVVVAVKVYVLYLFFNHEAVKLGLDPPIELSCTHGR